MAEEPPRRQLKYENQEPDSEGAAGLAGCTWTPILIKGGWVSAFEGAEGEYACLRELGVELALLLCGAGGSAIWAMKLESVSALRLFGSYEAFINRMHSSFGWNGCG